MAPLIAATRRIYATAESIIYLSICIVHTINSLTSPGSAPLFLTAPMSTFQPSATGGTCSKTTSSGVNPLSPLRRRMASATDEQPGRGCLPGTRREDFLVRLMVACPVVYIYGSEQSFSPCPGHVISWYTARTWQATTLRDVCRALCKSFAHIFRFTHVHLKNQSPSKMVPLRSCTHVTCRSHIRGLSI